MYTQTTYSNYLSLLCKIVCNACKLQRGTKHTYVSLCTLSIMMSLQNYMYKPLLIIIIIDYYSNLCNVLSTVLLLSFKPKERPLSLKLARGCSICAPNVAYTTVLLPRYL